MNLSAWAKGLGVFVASGFITSLAAVNLGPSSFNFTLAGLKHLAVLVLVIGVKSVLLYLRKSPLQIGDQQIGGQGGFIRWDALAPLLFAAILVIVTITATGCSPLEVQTYRSIVGAKAFLDSVKKVHPECAAGATTTPCPALVKATAAKDALIDLAEVYCSSPQFDQGGACTPPTDKTVQNQLAIKIRASLQIYAQAETDLKTVLK